MRKRNENISCVKELVIHNTGMDSESLLYDTHNYAFPALAKAKEMILEWKKKNKKFYVFADYDVDGITSGESVRMLLAAIGVRKENVYVRYPKRFSEGYGMSAKVVDEEFESGGVVITVDNGIAAFAAIEKAKEKGMEVLVTDHHLATVRNGEAVYPNADYCIDPNAIPGQAEFTPYCGCGIVLKLSEEMLKDYPDERIIQRIRANAAIATIADCVPLIGENRRIVKDGLKLITRRELMTKGLTALVMKSRIMSNISVMDVAFRIAPALNAMGRLYDGGAAISAKLISYDGDIWTADKLAEQQIAANEERKALQTKWSTIAQEKLSGFNDNHIILKLDECPEGVVGIIAGNLAERFKVPTIVMTDSHGILKGSGRSVDGVNLKALLDKCDGLSGYGGHAAAAGVRVADIDTFRKTFKEAIGNWQPAEKEVLYDLEVDSADVAAVTEEVEKYGPYGEGNPEPLFLVKNVNLLPNGGSYYKELDGSGVKLFAADFTATAFGKKADSFLKEKPRHLHILGTLHKNYYGNISSNIYLEDVFPMNNSNKRVTGLQALLAKKAAALS